MNIREAAGMLQRILNKRDKLTDTERLAFADMLNSTRHGVPLSEKQERWAQRVWDRVKR